MVRFTFRVQSSEFRACLPACLPACRWVEAVLGGSSGVTPWDLGHPTPAVVELVNSGTLPGDGTTTTTVLVPGCGAVRVLDIYHMHVQLFTVYVVCTCMMHSPPEKFDLIFDYTYVVWCIRASMMG